MTAISTATRKSDILDSKLTQLLLLTLAAGAASYSQTSMGPIQESLRTSLLLTDNQMGLLQGPALAVPMVVATIPLGILVDRYPRSRLLVVFQFLSIVGSLLTALATGFVSLFLARSIVGFATAAVATGVFSLLSDLYSAATRGSASMLVIVGQNGGMAAAFSAGGALLAASESSSEPWRWAMLGLTASLFVALAGSFGLRERPRTESLDEPLSCEHHGTHGRTVSLASIGVGAGLVAIEVGVFAAASWTAPMFERQFALPPGRVGTMIGAALLISGVLGPILGGPLADICQRTGGPRRTLWMLILMSLVSIPTGFLSEPEGILSTFILLTAFFSVTGAVCVASLAMFTIVSPSRSRGLYMATLMGICTLVGVGLAPIAVSEISGMLGGLIKIGEALSIVCAVSSAAATICFAAALIFYPVTKRGIG